MKMTNINLGNALKNKFKKIMKLIKYHNIAQ